MSLEKEDMASNMNKESLLVCLLVTPNDYAGLVKRGFKSAANCIMRGGWLAEVDNKNEECNRPASSGSELTAVWYKNAEEWKVNI